MKIILKDETKSLFISFIVFFFHLIFINLNPVNFEFSFSEAAKFFYNFDKKIIEEYFYNQANTFVFPFIVGFFDRILFIDNTLLTARLLSASSYFFIATGFIKLFKVYEIKVNCYIFLIIFYLNPLIWTYGHRGVPDLLAAAIAFYCFAKILSTKHQNNIKYFTYFFFIGISICIKPFSLIYLALIFILDLKKNFFDTVKKLIIPFLIAICLPIFYFLLNKINFNFYLIPHKFSSEVSFLKGGFFKNFFGYLIFLSVFIFPITFKKRYINIYNFLFLIFLILPLSFFLHFLTNSPDAELNFGFLHKFLDSRIIIFFGLTTCMAMFLNIRDNIKKNLKLFVIISIYLLILSFTRSSQRYLLTILPIVYLYFLVNNNFIKINIIFYLVAIFHIFINFLITINFYLNANINKEIVEYLSKKEIIKQTLPGPLYPHSYHLFLSDQNKKYIITTNPYNSLKLFNKKFLIINKNLYLSLIN